MSLEEDFERLERYREEGDQPAVANTLFRIGLAQFKKGRFEEGLAALQESYDICKVQGNDRGRAEILRRVVPQLIQMDKLDEAEAGLEVGFALADKLGSLSFRVDLLEAAALVDWKRNRPRQAVERLVMAAEICRENDDPVGQYILLEKTAPMLRAAGRYRDALRVYETLADLAEQAEDKARFALALVGQGQMHQKLGRLKDAVELLELALRVYKITGNVQSIRLVQGEIEALRARLGEAPAAEQAEPGGE